MNTVRFSDAAALWGRPESTLRGRCDRGFAPIFTAHTPGKGRRFSVRDIIGLAVMDEAMARGLPMRQAFDVARYALSWASDDGAEAGALADHVIFLYGDRSVVGLGDPRDHFPSSPDEIPSRSGIFIHVGRVAAEVLDRIRAFEAAKAGGPAGGLTGEKRRRNGGELEEHSA